MGRVDPLRVAREYVHPQTVENILSPAATPSVEAVTLLAIAEELRGLRNDLRARSGARPPVEADYEERGRA